MTLEEVKAEWPIGLRVAYQPTKGIRKVRLAQIRSVPWELGSGTIVIAITGQTGGVALDHLFSIEGESAP